PAQTWPDPHGGRLIPHSPRSSRYAVCPDRALYRNSDQRQQRQPQRHQGRGAEGGAQAGRGGEAMSRPDPRNVCDGCSLSFDRRLRSHVEHDDIWQQLAYDPRECLCDKCMYRRAWERLGRMLTLADLRPCRWNLEGPYSWLDLFVEMEGAPPSNLAEWRSVGERAQ